MTVDGCSIEEYRPTRMQWSKLHTRKLDNLKAWCNYACAK